jgi:hypothetical protein
MLLEGITTGKSFAAIFANKRFLPCVLTPVIFQAAFLYKGFVTHVTFVGSDVLVEFFMHF